MAPFLAVLVLAVAAHPSGALSEAEGQDAPERSRPPASARRITTDHLRVTTYVTEEVAAPGSLFSVVLDISPRERMHVYAPGAEGYKIITLTLEPNPLVVPRRLQYPPSETYFFEPLNERVPVFQKPFTLTQAMAVSTAPEHRAALAKAESVTIKGTLDYQACDDRICFVPQSVPVSYTVKLRPVEPERSR
ncbi:MAG: hypothetical protein HY657_18025 [Acidobacteria bacterium]|nr:hypothetical protein [Acidobacteriota bacterium]